MSEFDDALRELAGRLDLPEPSRSRVLLELRADLEAMGAALRADGLGAEEARTRAVRALVPSPETVAELGAVYRPLYERWVARLSAPGRHGLERSLVIAVAVVYLLTGLSLLARLDLMDSPSPFLWPVLLVAAGIATVSAVRLFQLFALGFPGARSRPGLRLLPALGGLALLIGLSGAAVDLYVLSGEIQADVARQLPATLAWFRREVVLLSVALLAAGVAGIVWILAAARIAHMERTETSALGFSGETTLEHGRKS